MKFKLFEPALIQFIRGFTVVKYVFRKRGSGKTAINDSI